MTMQTAVETCANQFGANPVVAQSIDAIVGELVAVQSSICSVRPPNPELTATYEQHLKRMAEVKGKPPLFKYLGSGFGRGALVELADGSVKWDLINGIGVYMFGHNDPELIRVALEANCRNTVMQGNLQCNHDATEFAELLIEEAARTSKIKHCFLANSGAMANESALKICYQKHAPASRVIAFSHCFMGRSTTMAQIGDSAAGRVGLPLNVQVDYIPFYDLTTGDDSINAAVEQLQDYIKRYPGQHACFVMELIQGEGGFNTAPREFFVKLMELCKQHDIAVWADEIQTFGRTECMFHFEQLELGQYIDVVTMGKMSQVCGCLYTADYNPKPGLLSATFIGSTVGLHVGRAMLMKLLDGGYYGPDGKIAKLQKTFRDHVGLLVEKHPEWFPHIDLKDGNSSSEYASGIGGMMRFTPFGGDRAMIIKAVHAMFDAGVIAFYCGHGPYHIRFLPPIGVMQPGDFENVFEIVESALDKVKNDE